MSLNDGQRTRRETRHIAAETLKGGAMRKFMSFDAETNGLWGMAFAIGALAYDEKGNEIAHFIGRLPDSAVTNEWVMTNVLPMLATVVVTHETYESLIADFAKFYLANKQDADIIVHMGVPVESKLLFDMHTMGFIGDMDGPYPLYDVAGNLQANGEDPTSVDKFIVEHSLSVNEFDGGTHNPLYDAAAAATVWRYFATRHLAQKYNPEWVESHRHGLVSCEWEMLEIKSVVDMLYPDLKIKYSYGHDCNVQGWAYCIESK